MSYKMKYSLDDDNIKDNVTKIKKAISDLESLLKYNQNILCKHSDIKRTAKGDTGNWCMYDDSYWYECKCNICGKTWIENQ